MISCNSINLGGADEENDVIASILKRSDKLIFWFNETPNCVPDSNAVIQITDQTIISQFINDISIIDSVRYKCGYEEGYIYAYNNNKKVA